MCIGNIVKYKDFFGSIQYGEIIFDTHFDNKEYYFICNKIGITDGTFDSENDPEADECGVVEVCYLENGTYIAVEDLSLIEILSDIHIEYIKDMLENKDN